MMLLLGKSLNRVVIRIPMLVLLGPWWGVLWGSRDYHQTWF